MRSGERRSFIVIEKPVMEKQPNGSVKTTWETFIELWASVETLKAYEKAAVVATWPGADQKITFRYIEGLLPTMRIVFNNAIYSILGVNNVNMRNRELILTCQSGVKSA